MKENNFQFFLDDINDRYLVKVFYMDDNGNLVNQEYQAKEIKRLDDLGLEIKEGNISNLDDFLNGMIRFEMVSDSNKFFLLPLRNMYMLNDINYIKNVNVKDMNGFTPLNINHIEVSIKKDMTKEFSEILDISKDYFGGSNSDKFNDISRINEIYKSRIKNDL